MGMMKRSLIGLALLELACAASALAADQVAPQAYQWPWWREMPWPAFAWIFPLLCFVMMVVMLLFMMRGGMACMRRGRPPYKSGFRDAMSASRNEPSASALEILNQRYVRGEIDKQEYEEKKAAITPC